MNERVLTSETVTRDRKRAKLREQQREAQERDDLQNVLSTATGRRFLWKLLVDAGVFRISFVAGERSMTDFNEGRRAQGNALFVRIQALNPEYYHLMAKEAYELDESTKLPPVEESKPVDPDTEETES